MSNCKEVFPLHQRIDQGELSPCDDDGRGGDMGQNKRLHIKPQSISVSSLGPQASVVVYHFSPFSPLLIVPGGHYI